MLSVARGRLSICKVSRFYRRSINAQLLPISSFIPRRPPNLAHLDRARSTLRHFRCPLRFITSARLGCGMRTGFLSLRPLIKATPTNDPSKMPTAVCSGITIAAAASCGSMVSTPVEEQRLVEQWSDFLEALHEGSPAILVTPQEMADSDMPHHIRTWVNQCLAARGSQLYIRRKRPRTSGDFVRDSVRDSVHTNQLQTSPLAVA